jgi:hypothetical protein
MIGVGRLTTWQRVVCCNIDPQSINQQSLRPDEKHARAHLCFHYGGSVWAGLGYVCKPCAAAEVDRAWAPYPGNGVGS